MAATLGKVVNLLRVEVPAAEPQILLRVRFADVDRSAATSFGFNLLSTGAATPSDKSPPASSDRPSPRCQSNAVQFTLSDALNIFLFRPDLNLGALIKALEAKNLLQMLAEPNVLAINGKPASFVAGGEFPFPVVQGGAAAGAVTIQFREYGVRINFLPVVTPRGIDPAASGPRGQFARLLQRAAIPGLHHPGLATRSVQTQVELESGQSFVIAGLLDNTITETLNKIPGHRRYSPAGQALPKPLAHAEQLGADGPGHAGVGAARFRPEARRSRRAACREQFLPGTADGGAADSRSEVTGAVPAPPVRKTYRSKRCWRSRNRKAAAHGVAAAPVPRRARAPGGVH